MRQARLAASLVVTATMLGACSSGTLLPTGVSTSACSLPRPAPAGMSSKVTYIVVSPGITDANRAAVLRRLERAGRPVTHDERSGRLPETFWIGGLSGRTSNRLSNRTMSMPGVDGAGWSLQIDPDC
jgi:hypothetical protein